MFLRVLSVSSNHLSCLPPLSVCLCASRVFCTSFDVVVRISRVGEVHTHQFDALVVIHDCCSDGPLVDVLHLVQHNANSVFVVFSCSHENVCLVCLTKF